MVAATESSRPMNHLPSEAAQRSPVELPGIDAAAVDAWWRRYIGEGDGGLTFELIAGGRSNLTFRVRDGAGRDTVLRRPPAGAILESAHDVLREALIVQALRDSGVAVPEVLAICDDRAVTGAPFYVMDHVDGVVLHDAADAAEAFTVPERRRVAENAIDVLARLHRIDPDAHGLGDLGRRDAYVERQLRRWHRQWQDSRTREVPLVDELHRRLSERIPPQGRSSIVHGDYRLGNLIVGEDATVRAVLDWELCTLGDPLADLGYTLAWWVTERDGAAHPLGTGPSQAPGMPGHAELVERYAAATGFDVGRINFYVAFAYWKVACIMEGVRVRDQRSSPETAPPLEQVPALAELGVLALDQ